MTIVLDFRGKSLNQRYLEQAADHMRKGNILIAPTETGYAFVGLASSKRVPEIFSQLRPTHSKQKPFSLLCADIAAVTGIALLDTPTFRLATKVWPGPYTLILPATKNAPKAYEKRKTVGIRITSNPVTSALCRLLDSPVMATSVTDADELVQERYFEDFQQEDAWWTTIQGIADFHAPQEFIALSHEEPIEMQVSTVLDCSQGNVEVLRDGGWEVRW